MKDLVENAKKNAPAVVEELIPEKMGYGEVQAVLRNLIEATGRPDPEHAGDPRGARGQRRAHARRRSS